MTQKDRPSLINFDWIMLLLVLLISGMSLINLYSSTYAGVGLGTFHKQLVFFLFGYSLIVLINLFDYRLLLKLNKSFYILVILLLLYALLQGGMVANTQRWINLGFFRLQPSEPAKLMLVISLAAYYYKQDCEHGLCLKDMGIPLLLTGLPFLLILKQPDLGTALMLGIIFVSMTLFVKLRWHTFATLSGTAGLLAFLSWKYFLKPYQRQRIETFLNPEKDPTNSGYHILQSKIAVGSGQWAGKGYLKGTQSHLHFLPERHTDFAFSVWAEEWGFVGCLVLLGAYFCMIIWGLNIGLSSRDKFGVLLAFGLVSLIFWQAIINLLMVMGFLPVVGIPLPLFSYGGSSLLTTMVSIGILMNIRMRRNQTTK